jgi:murein DD-endopeptidase MepM/ murein hydrolase activator NlpD
MPVDGEVKKDKAYDKETLVPWADGSWQTHEGIDITCDIGSEVKASADGKVVKVFNDDQLVLDNTVGWGMTVVIEHKNGIQTVYCNLGEDVKVKVGDTVKKGDVIAVVGDTATCEPAAIEGSHLHFAVIKKSGDSYETLDPSKYLK